MHSGTSNLNDQLGIKIISISIMKNTAIFYLQVVTVYQKLSPIYYTIPSFIGFRTIIQLPRSFSLTERLRLVHFARALR